MTFLKQTNPQVIAQAVTSLLLPNFPRRIYLAMEEGATGSGLHTGMLSCRGAFVTVIKGRAVFEIVQNRKKCTVVLEPGDLLLRTRNTWITLMPKENYLSLGGRIESDRFRFFFSQPMRTQRKLAAAARYSDIHKTPYYFRRSERQNCVKHLFDALSSCQPCGVTDPLLRDIARSILHCMNDALIAPQDQQGEGKAYNTFTAACSYIDEHCCQNISRIDIAKAIQIHETHVSRLFNQFSTHSFNEHLVKARLNRAHSLLVNPTLTLAEIANMCGFQSSSYFTRLYRKEYGHSPNEWRINKCQFK